MAGGGDVVVGTSAAVGNTDDPPAPAPDSDEPASKRPRCDDRKTVGDSLMKIQEKLQPSRTKDIVVPNLCVGVGHHFAKTQYVEIFENSMIGPDVIDPDAIEIVASAIANIAMTGGDAHQMFRIASLAVDKCLASLSDEEKRRTLESPVVNADHVSAAIGEVVLSKEVFTTLASISRPALVLLRVITTMHFGSYDYEWIRISTVKTYFDQASLRQVALVDKDDVESCAVFVKELVDANLLILDEGGHLDVSDASGRKVQCRGFEYGGSVSEDFMKDYKLDLVLKSSQKDKEWYGKLKDYLWDHDSKNEDKPLRCLIFDYG